ncbi:hypothetical protein TI04_08655 [Achromatium sp. WMS2]|nr:hypothetical protein TI04_08655 [Achromatium sp. WMS2]
MLFNTVESHAEADVCYKLWYKRNLIYAQNGYCFQSPMARRTFRGYSCWTSRPDFSKAEKRRISRIKAEERAEGCMVNQ